MRHLFKKILASLCLWAILSSCSTDDKVVDASRYKSVEFFDPALIRPAKELKNERIQLPPPSSNYYWPTSSWIPLYRPQHIAINQGRPITQQRAFKVHTSFDRDHYFVGNTPVVHGDMLFVLGQSRVYAYKFSDLEHVKWSVDFSKTSNDILRGGGLYVGGDYLAVTYGSNQVVVLDAKSGKELWRYELSSIARAAPLIYKGKVFVMTIDNKVYGFDLKNGLLQWTFEGMPEQLGIIRNVGLVAYNNMIVVPCSTGQILFIKDDSGELMQTLSLDSKLSLVNHIHTPVIDKDRAYISSYQGSIYALDLNTGRIIWDNSVIGGGALWLAGNYIYTINKYAQLVAVNKLSGSVKWVQDLPYTVLSGPILVNKELYVASSDGRLLVISPTDGIVSNEVSIPKGQYAFPIAVKDVMLLQASSGKLLVLN